MAAALGFFAFTGETAAADNAPDKTAVQDCLLKALETAPGGMTVNELRIRCKAEKMAAAKDQKDEGIVEARLYTDDNNVLRPFTLLAYKPNYILLANYNGSPNNEPWREATGDPNLELDMERPCIFHHVMQ
jgi:phospholipase A1